MSDHDDKLKSLLERLETEIDVIIGMGFPGYFMIVADFITWAKKNGIPVGPGRGSGAGSLVAYALVLMAVTLAGIWLCGRAAQDLGVHDHPGIVWDEIAGYLLTMMAAPAGWPWIVIGFVLFRLFDVWKPWPIGWLDRRVQGGLGIMLDDLVAGAALRPTQRRDHPADQLPPDPQPQAQPQPTQRRVVGVDPQRLDAVLVMLGPPDPFGYCSVGIHPDIVMSGIETAKTIADTFNNLNH
mgnify:CR=1 FL=1